MSQDEAPMSYSARYRSLTRIGRGGMGEVFLVEDRLLRRQVAMKVIRPDRSETDAYRLSFESEAQATSQLEHPGIPPIHDYGVTDDGRLYFTMKLVRGRTLDEVLHDLQLRRREVAQEYSLHRLITVIERIAEALHFAHERGVIHRDIKPENIMLGDYGEVHVMDWGVAKVTAADDESDADDLEHVETERVALGVRTEYGHEPMTVAWASPEQVQRQSNRISRKTDIYSLGCVLYQVLTLYPPFDEGDSHLISRIIAGDLVPPEERNPRRSIPEVLASICSRAMGHAPEDRFPSAQAMASELRSWLDGRSEKQRRFEEARDLASKGREIAAEHDRLERQIGKTRDELHSLAKKVDAWQPLSEKRELVEAQTTLRELEVRSSVALTEALQFLQASLFQRADDPVALETVGQILKPRLLKAELDGDHKEAAYALAFLTRYDDGRYAALLNGEGSLSLETTPAKASVTIQRLEQRNGVYEAGDPQPLGSTPLVDVMLPMGSYLCTITAKGFRDVRYPVYISRSMSWKGSLRLLQEAEIGKDFVYVPGGPCLVLCRRRPGESGPESGLQWVEEGPFLIQRHPVTFGEYIEFLEYLDSEGGPEMVKRRLPGLKNGTRFVDRNEDGTYVPLSVCRKPGGGEEREPLLEPPMHERCLAELGAGYEFQIPVYGVSWEDALAYCVWRSRQDGTSYRLPTESQWEKAARGVDGRDYPWGTLPDSSLASCREAREEGPDVEPVGRFPTARSLYGMEDAVGLVHNWTSDWFDERQTSKAIRGGAWKVPITNIRIGMRKHSDQGDRQNALGFRCVRPVARNA